MGSAVYYHLFYFIFFILLYIVYFILFYFILFYFILFFFIFFYFILFYFILFYFILFYFILFYFISFYFILFCFILWISHLCLKMSSFLHLCTCVMPRTFLCAHAQCPVNFIHHVEFYFRFQHLITFPVYSQLWHTFMQRSSSVKGRPIGCLLSKVVFRQIFSSMIGRLPSKVI